MSQPAPTANEHPPIVPLVVADLCTRMAVGIQRYSVPLQPANGRHQLTDAYEEAQDLTLYLRGAIETDRIRQALVDELVASANDVLDPDLRRTDSEHRLRRALAAVEEFTGGRVT